MKRRAAIGALLLLLGPACAERGADDRPHLIYLLTIDALRSDVIGLRHKGKLVMPSLTRFARESIHFDHAYSQAPFTKISVASLFTAGVHVYQQPSGQREPGSTSPALDEEQVWREKMLRQLGYIE